MSRKERNRMLTFSRVRDQAMSVRAASEVLSLSYRQTRRIYRRFIAEGNAGLVHRSRGRSSNRGFDQAFKNKVIARYQNRYEGFGPTLACEKLAEEGLLIDHETLRRWLISAGLIKRRRKRAKHRTRRERCANFGEMVQMDGSHHAWFEDRADSSCLMDMIDDATGVRLSLIDTEETTAVAMRLLIAWIEKYGVPEAVYVDKKNVFVTDREPTLEEQLRGEEPLTQFGRACQKLGIRIIAAHSPQAKGRIERCHGVFQDRFVKEMRLEGISSIEDANRLLESDFTDKLNDKFASCPTHFDDRHRPLRRDEDLAAIFSFEETRSVANDFTVRYRGRIFQIERQRNLPRPPTRITVQRRLDETVHLICEGRELIFTELDNLPEREVKARTALERRTYTPSPDHPWKRERWSKRPPMAAAP